MNLLMIDSSSIVATAAVVSEEKLVAEIIVNHQKKHAEKLMPAIDHLLDDAGLTIAEMDAFGIVVGPGSFTGLRIGLATIKGFAQALNKPVVGVSTLEALAYNLACSNGVVCPILDAQRNQTYGALFAAEGDGKIERLTEDRAMDIDELIAELKNFDDAPVYLLGDGVPRFGEALSTALSDVRQVPVHLNMNRASSAGVCALAKLEAGEAVNYKIIEPLYIRPSYAEENK